MYNLALDFRNRDPYLVLDLLCTKPLAVSMAELGGCVHHCSAGIVLGRQPLSFWQHSRSELNEAHHWRSLILRGLLVVILECNGATKLKQRLSISTGASIPTM